MTALPLVAPARTARPRGLTSEAVFVRRSILHTLRTPDALVTAIAMPVMLMLMFTFVFGGALEAGGDYVDYVVPGIILLCAGFGAASVAVDVAQDMTTGIVDRFRTMPLRAWGVVTGHVVASLVRNLLATAIVVGVGIAIGFRPNADPLEWIGALAVVALYIVTITYLFAGVGLAASSPEAAQGYGFFLMFLPYVSSAFVPVDTMPTWLQWVAANQPLTPIIETIRGLLLGTEVGWNGLLAVGWCALILVFAVTWSSWLFGRKAGRR
jgi:ABC-2 type transport system permease protein